MLNTTQMIEPDLCFSSKIDTYCTVVKNVKIRYFLKNKSKKIYLCPISHPEKKMKFQELLE